MNSELREKQIRLNKAARELQSAFLGLVGQNTTKCHLLPGWLDGWCFFRDWKIPPEPKPLPKIRSFMGMDAKDAQLVPGPIREWVLWSDVKHLYEEGE